MSDNHRTSRTEIMQREDAMRIGIIGAGSVGGSLGKLWAAGGHDVMFGVRDVQSPKVQTLLLSIEENAEAADVARAIDFGEVIVLAVGWPGVAEVLSQGEWSGKIILDATNRDVFDYEKGDNAAAEVARLAPGARIVKAFNTLGAEQFGQPDFDGEQATMFICGDDDDAKATVTQLTEELGFDVVDAGPLANASLLESLAKLWIYLAIRGGLGRGIAFKLLRR
jgi:hypothetical protein